MMQHDTRGPGGIKGKIKRGTRARRRWIRRRGGLTILLACLSAWSLVVGNGAVVSGPAAAAQERDLPAGVEKLAPGATDVPDPKPWEESTSVPLLEPAGGPPLKAPAFPEHSSWVVELGDEGATGRPVAGVAGPVEIAVPTPGRAGRRIGVEVFGRDVARRASVSGFVFEVSGLADRAGRDDLLSSAARAGEPLPAELSIDYAAIASAYGGDYMDRLRVVALPRCVLDDPVPAGCRVGGDVLPSRNNLDAHELVVTVEDLAELAADGVDADPFAAGELGLSAEEVAAMDWSAMGAGPAADHADSSAPSSAEEAGVVFAVTAGPSGESGTFAATDLSVTGEWLVSNGSGEFSYTYDMDLPEPAAGEAPSVGLSYSSGAVDGLTNATNTQGPQNGVGWSDFAGAFIERRYEPCVRTVGTPDLCWNNHNAVLSLSGTAGTLRPLNADFTEWRVHADAGWRVERLTGANNGVHDGEHWKVTGSDGTQYFFGLGRNPETGAATRSAWGVQVISDHTGEPCRTPDDEIDGCVMAWRWNLDRVIDPNGNVTRYFYIKETNKYNAVGGIAGPATYDRGGRLERISYGGREGSSRPAARVLFGATYRCAALDNTCTNAPSRGSSASKFPDVPVDLICRSSTRCPETTPTFFSTKRYSYVRTEVRVGSQWRPVSQYNLYHRHFIHDRDTNRGKLYLRAIQHAGISQGGLMAYPSTEFSYRQYPNRVDVSTTTGVSAMVHWRIRRVTTPFGGRTDVTYGHEKPCDRAYRPSRWDQNDRDCFPQSTGMPNDPLTGVFHKYLVTKVDEDPRAWGPHMVTTYDYEGDPAWAFYYGAFAGNPMWGWADWRGYETVTVTRGTSKTRIRLFRGMDGDRRLVEAGGGDFDFGTREVDVTSLDGSRTFDDHYSLGGRVVEEAQLGTVNGQGEVPLRSTLYEYDRQTTYDLGEDRTRHPEWAEVATVTESVATASGESRERRVRVTYNDKLQVVSSLEEGWLDVDGDERCATTTYADNPARNMFTYPARMTSLAGGCDSSDVLKLAESYYDGTDTLGAPPTRGNVTRQRAQIDEDTWSEISTAYDDLGRPVAVTDARGGTVTTAYQAAQPNFNPTQITVTNQMGHVATTTLLPEYGVPLREEDPNGNVTTYAYDAFGRVTRVRLPTEQPYEQGKAISWAFAYHPTPDRRAVRARQLTSRATSGSGVVYEDSWVIYDGFWRERQVQTLSPEPGKVLVSETGYNGRGLLANETAPQAVDGVPGTGIFGLQWDNRTRHRYDELGREVAQDWFRGPELAYSTTFSYTVDSATATDPDGGMTRETIDGLGRTVSVAEFDGQRWQPTTYEYDLADNLTSVTDPAGNRMSYSYNRAGWRIAQDDPDRGSARLGYDLAGNVTHTVDGAGTEIHTSYDALNRPLERRAGGPDGELLASWEYDAPGQLGLAHRETRHTSDGDWVSEVIGYDGRDRPLGSRLTVPDGIPGLSGTYEVTQTYDRADRITAVTYPAVGGLPQETVTTTYDALGHARSMAGLDSYVNQVNYDGRGRPIVASLGPTDALYGWMIRGWFYDQDQRLARTEALLERDGGYHLVNEHDLSYTNGGDVAERTTRQDGLAWRECFDYDARHRLVEAFTVNPAETCANGQPGTGDRPYRHSYRYSADGRLLERVEDGTSVAYSYPASGQARPHAPVRVGDDTYSWDSNGNLTERTVDGVTETFTWDAEHQLASVDGASGTTSFVYNAEGQRLLRRTADGATLYFAGHEITANADGSAVTAVRSYTFGSTLVATRTRAGVEYVLSDGAGSLEMAAPSGGTPGATRSYTPFGQVRAEDGEMPTDRGFIGQVEDSTTNLSYLNARYYDTTTGVFISPDPIYDTANPKSLNPYTYSQGNPTTLSDPSGMAAKRSQLQNIIRVQAGIITVQRTLIRVLYQRLVYQQAIIGVLRGIIAVQAMIIRVQRAVMNVMAVIIRVQAAVIRIQAAIIRVQAAIIRIQSAIIRIQAAIIRIQSAIIRIQRGIIAVLGSIIRRQASVIAFQAAVIGYQRHVINAQAATIRRLQNARSGSGGAIRLAGSSRSAANPCEGFGCRLESAEREPWSDTLDDFSGERCVGGAVEYCTEWSVRVRSVTEWWSRWAEVDGEIQNFPSVRRTYLEVDVLVVGRACARLLGGRRCVPVMSTNMGLKLFETWTDPANLMGDTV